MTTKTTMIAATISLILAAHPPVFGQVFRHKALFHATDCTSLTGKKANQFCYQLNDNKWFVCEPISGDCDTAAEWVEPNATSGGGWTDNGTVVVLTTLTDRIGIGTPSPDAGSLVHIKGSNYPELQIESTDTSGGTLALVSSTGEWQWYVEGTDLRLFESGFGDRLTFAAGGDLGLGVTPADLLHIKGTAALDGSDPVTFTIDDGQFGGWTAGATFAEINIDSQDGSGGGVGTVAAIRFFMDDTFGSKTSIGWFTENDSGDPLAERMRLTAPGNLCIGATSCSSPLSVTGNIEVTGTVQVVVGLDRIGAGDLDYGSGDVTDHTFLTDGTGTGEVVLPAQSIDSTEILDNTIVPADVDETADYSFTTLSGKQLRFNTLVNDDDCTGDQSKWWYDTTDGRFEFCNAGAGAPAILAGGGGAGAFADAADPVVLQSVGKDVVIGPAQVNTSKLTVDGDADQVQFTIQGNAAQAADLFVIEKSDGTELFVVEADGGIGIGVTPATDFHIQTNDNSTTPAVRIENLNGTGDTSLQFKVPTANYSMGIDASISDRFAISVGASVGGAAEALIIDTSGNVTLGNQAGRTVTIDDILAISPQATAPATCGIGEFYTDTSGAACHCSSTNTWTSMHGIGSCV